MEPHSAGIGARIGAGIVLATEGGEQPILFPAAYDIIWSTVCFVIILVLFWRWVLPQARKALDARTEGIEMKLEKAERDRVEAASLLAQYREQLASARAEAANIRAQAQSDRAAIIDEARSEAQAAASAVYEREHAQLQAERQQAVAQLRRDVGTLAVDLAQRVVGESLDQDRARSTVDRFIDDLEQIAPSAGQT